MTDYDDRMMDLLLGIKTGGEAVPDLRERILAAAKHQHATRPCTSRVRTVTHVSRRRTMLWAASAAACTAIGLALIWFGRDTTPKDYRHKSGDGGATTTAEVTLPAGMATGEHHWLVERAGGYELQAGWLLLSDTPTPVSAGEALLQCPQGRALVVKGDRPDNAGLTIVSRQLQTRGIELSKEDRDMLNNPKSWLVRGGAAMCVLAGGMLINGDYVPAGAENGKPDTSVKEVAVPQIAYHSAALQWLADHQHEEGWWCDDTRGEGPSARKDKGAVGAGFADGVASPRAKEDAKPSLLCTGLALNAFLGDGHTHRDGAYKDNVDRAAKWLLKQMDEAGLDVIDCLKPAGKVDPAELGSLAVGYFSRSFKSALDVNTHAVCTSALAELYALTADGNLKLPAQRAVNTMYRASWVTKDGVPGFGWEQNESDSKTFPVSPWTILAFKSASIAELEIGAPERSVDGKTQKKEVFAAILKAYGKALEYKATWEEHEKSENRDRSFPAPAIFAAHGFGANGRYSPNIALTSGYAAHPSLEASGLMATCMCRTEPWKPDAERITALAQKLIDDAAKVYPDKSPRSETKPNPNAEFAHVDFAHWYIASLALFQAGDTYWKPWSKTLMEDVLSKTQRGWHDKDIARFGADITSKDDTTQDKKANGSDHKGRFVFDEFGSWDPVDAWHEQLGRAGTTALNAMTTQVHYRYVRTTKDR